MEFMEAGMYTSLPLPFDLGDIAPMEAPRHVLLCDPGHFDIVDEKNVHMQGQAGNVDKTKAQAQWTALRDTYIGLRAGGILAGVEILPGAAGCEDMVFCANQSFPWQLPGGERIVVMSWMRHASRQREVGWFEDFFQKKGVPCPSSFRQSGFRGHG